jgi:hypothetical protein
MVDDIARRHGAALRVVFDLLPEGAARPAPGARFGEIWGDLVDWGPVTLIVHTEDGVFETKAPLPPGSKARGYFNIHGESPLGGPCSRSLSGATKSANFSRISSLALSGYATLRPA